MKPRDDVPMGVECAWPAPPRHSLADRLWTGLVAIGAKGNSVIGWHRDTHLAFLREIKPGDALIVERTDGIRLSYRVSSTEVLDRRDVWVMEQAGSSQLALVTRYPFDARRAGGPQRYVLLAFLS